MRIVKAGAIVLGSLAVLALAIAIAGLLLPKDHVETRSAVVAAKRVGVSRSRRLRR